MLEEIKSIPRFRRIPVVVLTTSNTEEDILRAYDLGANSYIVKPADSGLLVEALKTLESYWLEVVSLPGR